MPSKDEIADRPVADLFVAVGTIDKVAAEAASKVDAHVFRAAIVSVEPTLVDIWTRKEGNDHSEREEWKECRLPWH